METGQVGEPREYLNPGLLARDAHGLGTVPLTLRGHAGRIRRRLRGGGGWTHASAAHYSRRGVRRTLRKLADRYTGPTGVLALNVHWQQYERVMLDKGVTPDVWRVPVTWIWIRRADEVRQAVSWTRAVQTNVWNSENAPGSCEPTYDAAQIRTYLERCRQHDAAWGQYFADAGIEPLTLCYEELGADYDATVRRVLSYLGVEGVPVPAAPIRRQSDALNEEWRQRFLAEGALGDGPGAAATG